ncbi:hypothetical protein M0804_007729 [Polistes exclamans]|nr:hypothetical protein M0804_007729 [Polistes exclamans]
MELLKEVSDFLNINTRLDLKAVALQNVLNITGSKEGIELLLGCLDILKQLVILMQDESTAIAKDAALSAINISADEAGATAFLTISESLQEDKEKKYSHNLIHVCMSSIMDKNSLLADPCCMILSNVTRPKYLVDRVITLFEKTNYSWDSVMAAFTAKKYNLKGANLHYLGPVFSNLTQSPSVRKYVMDKTSYVIQRLLPFTEYPDSIIRRGGIIGTLKNCCFDVEHHEWLLSKDVNILCYLLLPLAGPEEFDEEENDKLPLHLQYLPSTKERESDPDIRIMLLEALGQLCATKKGREILRDNNTYVILRELHKSEKSKEVLLACENVVDILIRTEEEIGLDNIKDVDVPVEYKEKFEKMDEEFINST